jgi:hypothetical protein
MTFCEEWGTEEPIEDEAYWVTDGCNVWLAEPCRYVVGDWVSLGDTDHDYRVAVAWMHIPRPKALRPPYLKPSP